MFESKSLELEAVISFYVALTTNGAITNPHIRCSAIKSVAFFTQMDKQSQSKSVENAQRQNN